MRYICLSILVDMNNTKPWHVIYTLAHNEKKVFQQLEQLELEVYLPLHITIRSWSDRKKKVEVPLFTSYIFVRSDERDYRSIVETYGVSHFVYYCGRPAVISDKEIEAIKKFLTLSEGYSVKVEMNSEVIINKGFMAGKTGRVIKIGKDKLKLRIDSLGVIITADVERDSVVLS